MLNLKNLFNLAIAFLFAITISGCYTQLAPRLSDEDAVDAPAEEEYVAEEEYGEEEVEYVDEGDVDVYIYGGYPVYSYYYYDNPFWDPFWDFQFSYAWDPFRYRSRFYRTGFYFSAGYDPFYWGYPYWRSSYWYSPYRGFYSFRSRFYPPYYAGYYTPSQTIPFKKRNFDRRRTYDRRVAGMSAVGATKTSRSGGYATGVRKGSTESNASKPSSRRVRKDRGSKELSRATPSGNTRSRESVSTRRSRSSSTSIKKSGSSRKPTRAVKRSRRSSRKKSSVSKSRSSSRTKSSHSSRIRSSKSSSRSKSSSGRVSKSSSSSRSKGSSSSSSSRRRKN